MKLTTKGRYAVTAMIELALHCEDTERVTLRSIADHHGISVPYLEQLFSKLKSRNLVRGVRGPGGGYTLTRSPDQISIYQIINAVDESVDVTRCYGREDCQDGEMCLTHELWSDLSDKMSEFLSDMKLVDVIESPRVKAGVQRQSERQAAAEVQHVVFS